MPTATRKPLVHVDGPILPSNLTPAELQAAGGTTITPSGMVTAGAPVQLAKLVPLIPGWLTALAGVAVPALAYVAHVVPAPFGWILGVLAFVAAALCGMALPMPSWVAGKPLVPVALVPIFASAVPVLVGLSQTLTGAGQLVVYTLALICAGLAGLAAPQPVKLTSSK